MTADVRFAEAEALRQRRTFDYQLFTITGQYVTTVVGPPLVPGVICWRDRYFAAREGRYVEVQVFRTDEKPR